jgi:hypothetical protein
LSRFDIGATTRSVIRTVSRPILRFWYMPCITVVSTGCLIPLPLHPQEPGVPTILNPTPDDGTVEIDPFSEKTIRAVVTDPDTLISDLIVLWTVGDEDITYLSTRIPYDPDDDDQAEEQYDLSVTLDLDYNELSDHDQDTIELYVSDHDNEVDETWLLTVLLEKP